MTRILIADDHDVVRSGIRRIIEDQPGWSVVAEATDGKDAIAKAIATEPDVAILEYALPLIDGVEVTRQMRLRVPNAEVLIFTLHDNNHLLRDMVKAGARGYVLKSDAAQHLISAIQSLAAHRPFFSGQDLQALEAPRQCDQPLSNRERGIVRLIAEGHSQKQIARLLTISAKTVETHRRSIWRKLGLTSMAALVRCAIRNNLIEA
jgi:DNA-binding NarL/FixJ family response regulator